MRGLRGRETYTPPGWGLKPREVVEHFACAMEERLAANDHKGWPMASDEQFLMAKLVEEVGELLLSVTENAPRDEILREAADVANVALMLADIRNALHQPVVGM